MDERRISVNVEIMPPSSPGESHANSSQKADLPVRTLTMTFKMKETLCDMLEQIKTRWEKNHAGGETKETYFTSMQSLANGDLILEDEIGWHFHEGVKMAERVVRMRRNLRDSECSIQSGITSQSPGLKRGHLEATGSNKRRKLENGSQVATAITIYDDTPATSPENAMATSGVSRARESQSAEMAANDHEGFAMPSMPANSRPTVLVPDSQPHRPNGSPSARTSHPQRPLQTPPTSSSAAKLPTTATFTSIQPAPAANKTDFQTGLSTRTTCAFSTMIASQQAQSSQPSGGTGKNRRWTREEDAALKEGKRANLTMPEIIKQYGLHGRSDSALRNRIRDLEAREKEVQQQLNSQLQVTSILPSSQSQEHTTPVQVTDGRTEASQHGSQNEISQSCSEASSSSTSTQTSSPVSSAQSQQHSTPVQVTDSRTEASRPGSQNETSQYSPSVKFDWPSPPYDKRPQKDGMINVGTHESPHYMKSDHPWLESDNFLWTKAATRAKREWVHYLYNHLKAENVHLVYMAMHDYAACKRLNRTRRLARAEVRRKMGLCSLQDKARPRYHFERTPELAETPSSGDRDSPDVPDSEFSLDIDEDDHDDIWLMYKDPEMAAEDGLRALMNQSEDDGDEDENDPYPNGVIHDRHVSEVADEEEEELDDYDKEHRILDIPPFRHQRYEDEIEDTSSPVCQREPSAPIAVYDDAGVLVETRHDSVAEVDVYDGAKNYIETRPQLRSLSPAVEPTRLISTRSGYEMVVDSIKDADDGPTDAEMLKGFAESGEFDDYGGEDGKDVKCDKKEANTNESGIRAYFAPVKREAVVQSHQQQPHCIGLDGTTDEPDIGAKCGSTKKPKKKSKPGFGYVERTEEQLQAAREAEPSPRTLKTIIEVPLNEDFQTSHRANDSTRQIGAVDGRRGARRRERRLKKRARKDESNVEKPSSRTTISIKGSPLPKGSTTNPTPTKVAAQQNKSFVKMSNAQQSAWMNSPPPQPKFKITTPPKRPATLFPRPQPNTNVQGRSDLDKYLNPDNLSLLELLAKEPLSPLPPRPKTPPLKLPYASDDDDWDWSTDGEPENA